MVLKLPPGAPEWGRTLVNQLEAALQTIAYPKGPVRLKACIAGSGASDPTRTLPSPTGYAGAVVWVSDISRVAGCNGAHWIRQDTGATI